MARASISGRTIKMSTQITGGEASTKWVQDYGIEKIPILLNKEATKSHILAKNGKFVAVVGDHYRVLPNELAIQIANESAEMSNLRAFSEFGGNDGARMEGQSHVLMNRWKVHAMYDSGRDVDIEGDKVKLGLSVHNSIDGSMGFGVGIFTYRFTCSNMAFAGFKGYEAQGKTLEWIYSRHTESLTGAIDALKDKMVMIMEKVHLIADSYDAMSKAQATEELINKIKASKISKKILPEYCTAEELQVTDLSEWNVYNDITEAIWHNGKSNLDTKITQFGHLHRIMPLIPRRLV
jgi:hypothetical protein